MAEREPSEIDRIAERWVDTMCELVPTTKVWLGRPEHSGAYEDLSPEGHSAYRDAQARVLSELRAATPRDAVDEVTALDLSASLSLGIERFEAGDHLDELNVIASPAQSVREIFDLMPADSEQDWADIRARLGAVPDALRGYEATLRLGVQRGRTPALRQVERTAEQLGQNLGEDGFFGALADRAARLPQPLPETLRAELAVAARRACAAYEELIAFLRDELAPHARAEDAVGRERYERASRGFLGAAVDLDEAYDWGLEELARMVAEQEAVAAQLVPGGGVPDAVALLDADPARAIEGTEALREWMQRTADRAIAELGRSHFDIPEPVRTIECMIAPTGTGAIYYTGPSDDFARPGRMWWSVPEGVDRFSTWRELTTVYHEGVPGHHLQIGQATYNRAELNLWRRSFAGASGHWEGWALYAERLMAELGYLDDPGDRLGMLDAQRMRAARVVLDIGVHLGKTVPEGGARWSAEYALDFFRRHVNMDDAFLRFEVDRYLGWPGQAPSYKIGQRIWEQLRDDARRREGAAFDLKAFHTRALNLGSLGLDALRRALASAPEPGNA